MGKRLEVKINGYTVSTDNEAIFNSLIVQKDKGYFNIADSESMLRQMLMTTVELAPKGYVLVNGNTVWHVTKLLKQFKRLIKDYRVDNFPDYLYQFFSLSCGSIAHFNKLGWFETYPTLEALKQFFRNNEFGTPVKEHAPSWHYDAKIIQEEMSKLLGV